MDSSTATQRTTLDPDGATMVDAPGMAGVGLLAALRRRLTFANLAASSALLVALGSGTAYASGYLVTKNSDVAPSTIAGHHTPTGDGANIIAGTINGTDIQPGSIGSAQLTAPEGWRPVVDPPSDPLDYCGGGAVAMFCASIDDASTVSYWHNAGGGFTTAAFYRDAQQRVNLRGLVSFYPSGLDYDHPAPETVPIFVLPAGYRPTHEVVLTTLDNDSGGSYLVRVDIGSDGRVMVVNDDEPHSTSPLSLGCQFLSLDGISFRVGE